MAEEIPSGRLSRGKVVGKALLKIGVQKGRQMVGALKPASVEEEIAEVIFEALGELRGVSVKIAQQMALAMPFLPKAYLEKIEKSFNAIPPINKALVRKIIKTELGSYPQEIFDTFESEAFAAASLGQVHLARYEGKSVAVKVQYPGIKKSIETDMGLIRFALKRFARGEDIAHIVQEIEERLNEEVDYLLEAENTRFFRTHLQNKRIEIPEVYEILSTHRVLCCSYIEGLDLNAYLSTNPSQEQIDAYAQLIFENFFDSLYRLKRIHADPNPGNFLFLEDGRLGLIDFGCIKQVEEDFLRRYNTLHLELIEGADDERLMELYLGFGMIGGKNHKEHLHYYREVIKPLDRLYIEPMQAEVYDFGKCRNFSRRGFEAIFAIQKKQFQTLSKLNETYLFLDRTLLGYYALFEKMGAKIKTEPIRQRMKEY